MWNNKETYQQESLCSSTDESLVIGHYFDLRGFRYDTIAHSLGEYHEIYMNLRTLKTGLDPGSWIVDVPFKTGFLCVLSPWKPSIAIMTKHGHLQVYLFLHSDVNSANLETLLKPNLSPGFTFS